jgi:hypothetical protein
VGAWNGDGVDGIGLYKAGLFLLRSNTASGVVDRTFRFGLQEPGWQPLVGDWNGDGIDTIGLYKDGRFMLRDSNSAGASTYQFQLGDGSAGWTALAGDWDGSGAASVGLYREGMFYLTNAIDGSGLTRPFAFGPTQAGWIPLTGDWDADGITTVGLYRASVWRLRNNNSAGSSHLGFNFGPTEPGWQPLASYRGGMTPLMALAQAAESQPLNMAETAPAPTEPLPTQTPESVTLTPEPTSFAEVTETVVSPAEPTLNPEVTEAIQARKFSGQGKELHLHFPRRCTEPDRHVRPQAEAGRVAWAATAEGNDREGAVCFHSERVGGFDGERPQVHARRAMRDGDFRLLAAHGDDCR